MADDAHAISAFIERMGVLGESLATAEREISPDNVDAQARLVDMHHFVDTAREQTRNLIDSLKSDRRR